ncbi:MAG: response regulator transcription factor [Defluviitaleaceae bacterium]|nr:response regulator transcription factor [Defluviitaleaceae bacterium]
MNIILADDDKIVETALKTIIEAGGEIKIIATCDNGQDAVELYKKHSPNVALLDIRMPKMTGIDAAKEIQCLDPNAKILFLTTFDDSEYITTALSIGAKGYILKQDYESIVPALKAVEAGQTVLGGEIVQKLSTNISKPDLKKWNLADKEVEIIALVGQGLNNKEIAKALFLSEGTVRNYLSEILRKLDLRDRTQLAVFYYKSK